MPNFGSNKSTIMAWNNRQSKQAQVTEIRHRGADGTITISMKEYESLKAKNVSNHSNGMDVGNLKEAFIEMLEQGEKISKIYSGKRIDEEILKYATVGARNYIYKFSPTPGVTEKK